MKVIKGDQVGVFTVPEDGTYQFTLNGITKAPINPISKFTDDEIMEEYLKRFTQLGKALNE